MARTLNDDEEREKRVILVGELFELTGLSTRKLSAFLTNNFFPISNSTVSDYLQRFCKMRPNEVELIKERITNNTSDSIEKEEVKNRVIKNMKLFEQGFTIEEIADNTNDNFWSVYRDITVRSRKIDPEHFEEVIKPQLIDNARSNLSKKK